MSYSVDPLTDNCYEGTTCLINKFNIRDMSKLKELEAMVTLAKASDLEKLPLKKNFNVDDYCDIHRMIFGTLYDWAGEYRTINISKKTTSFAEPNKIPELLTNCFTKN